jgi:tetrahydromethanopterin S-methyltransferase subunit G
MNAVVEVSSPPYLIGTRSSYEEIDVVKDTKRKYNELSKLVSMTQEEIGAIQS